MTVSVTAATACYDGTDVFPVASAPVQTRLQRTVQLTVTALIVAGPFAGLAAAVWLLWGHGVGFFDVGLGLFFYLVTGFGATVGFHRCLTHRSFTAARAADCPGGRGLDGLRGRCDRLGGHAPASSRVHRSPGRSPFALPVRHGAGRAAARRTARPRWMAVR